MGSSVQGRSLI